MAPPYESLITIHQSLFTLPISRTVIGRLRASTNGTSRGQYILGFMPTNLATATGPSNNTSAMDPKA